MTKHSRKDFLKKLGLTITGTSVSLAGFSEEKEADDLIPEQLEFLKEYEIWLKEFRDYNNKRKSNPQDFTNNKRLMQLSEESEKRRKTLELYMKDKDFAKYFNKITSEITNSI